MVLNHQMKSEQLEDNGDEKTDIKIIKNEFLVNLNNQAKNKKIDKVIGRKKEIERLDYKFFQEEIKIIHF